MHSVLVVTGATGILGRRIVSAALGPGFTVRQAVRNPGKANPAAEAIRLDYAERETFAPALRGVSRLLLMAPPLDPNAPAELGPLVAEAKAAGVQHLVFILISAFGVNHNEQALLGLVEHLVMDSGVAYTILRPNFFMENFSEGFLSAGIKQQGVIALAAGDGKTSFLSVQDIAAAVVSAFRQELGGGRIIGEVSGRGVEYRPLSEEEMLAGARGMGMPEPAVR